MAIPDSLLQGLTESDQNLIKGLDAYISGRQRDPNYRFLNTTTGVDSATLKYMEDNVFTKITPPAPADYTLEEARTHAISVMTIYFKMPRWSTHEAQLVAEGKTPEDIALERQKYTKQMSNNALYMRTTQAGRDSDEPAMIESREQMMFREFFLEHDSDGNIKYNSKGDPKLKFHLPEGWIPAGSTPEEQAAVFVDSLDNSTKKAIARKNDEMLYRLGFDNAVGEIATNAYNLDKARDKKVADKTQKMQDVKHKLAAMKQGLKTVTTAVATNVFAKPTVAVWNFGKKLTMGVIKFGKEEIADIKQMWFKHMYGSFVVSDEQYLKACKKLLGTKKQKVAEIKGEETPEVTPEEKRREFVNALYKGSGYRAMNDFIESDLTPEQRLTVQMLDMNHGKDVDRHKILYTDDVRLIDSENVEKFEKIPRDPNFQLTNTDPMPVENIDGKSRLTVGEYIVGAEHIPEGIFYVEDLPESEFKQQAIAKRTKLMTMVEKRRALVDKMYKDSGLRSLYDVSESSLAPEQTIIIDEFKRVRTKNRTLTYVEDLPAENAFLVGQLQDIPRNPNYRLNATELMPVSEVAGKHRLTVGEYTQRSEDIPVSTFYLEDLPESEFKRSLYKNRGLEPPTSTPPIIEEEPVTEVVEEEEPLAMSVEDARMDMVLEKYKQSGFMLADAVDFANLSPEKEDQWDEMRLNYAINKGVLKREEVKSSDIFALTPEQRTAYDYFYSQMAYIEDVKDEKMVEFLRGLPVVKDELIEGMIERYMSVTAMPVPMEEGLHRLTVEEYVSSHGAKFVGENEYYLEDIKDEELRKAICERRGIDPATITPRTREEAKPDPVPEEKPTETNPPVEEVALEPADVSNIYGEEIQNLAYDIMWKDINARVGSLKRQDGVTPYIGSTNVQILGLASKNIDPKTADPKVLDKINQILFESFKNEEIRNIMQVNEIKDLKPLPEGDPKKAKQDEIIAFVMEESNKIATERLSSINEVPDLTLEGKARLALHYLAQGKFNPNGGNDGPEQQEDYRRDSYFYRGLVKAGVIFDKDVYLEATREELIKNAQIDPKNISPDKFKEVSIEVAENGKTKSIKAHVVVINGIPHYYSLDHKTLLNVGKNASLVPSSSMEGPGKVHAGGVINRIEKEDKLTKIEGMGKDARGRVQRAIDNDRGLGG